MIKACMQIFHKLTRRLFLNMDYKNNVEFEMKYTVISLQRGMLFKKITVFINIRCVKVNKSVIFGTYLNL